MTELDAMNVLLRAIGSSPVNSLTAPHPDAANARATLNRVKVDAQKRGWWFNIDYNVMYYPNSIGEIVIESQVLSLVDTNGAYLKRGNKLYDKFNNTFKFNGPINIHRTVRNIPWDELPESMKTYIVYRAAADFVRDEIEDRNKEHSFKEDAGVAMIDVKKEDLESGQYNKLHTSRALAARKGVRPYARGFRRFSGDPDA